MRPYSILVVVLLLSLPGEAMAARWEKDVIPVSAYVPSEWISEVEQAVEDYNHHLPPRSPRLDLILYPDQECPARMKDGQIHICRVLHPENQSVSVITLNHRAILKVRIELDPDPRESVHSDVCHELMHALTNVPDDYSARRDSCVQGDLDHLGSWDIAYLARTYSRGDGRGHARHH